MILSVHLVLDRMVNKPIRPHLLRSYRMLFNVMRKIERRAHWPWRAFNAGSAVLCTGCMLELPAPVSLSTTDATDDAAVVDPTTSMVDSNSDTTNVDTTAAGPDTDSGPLSDAQMQTDDPTVSGDADTGSGSDAPSVPVETGTGCEDGETLCGVDCVPIGECECGEICELDHAVAECRAGECVIAACDADYVDCDGEAANGCEMSFAAPASDEELIAVPPLAFQMSVTAMSQQDWEGIRRFPLDRICSSCERSSRPPGVPAIEPASNRDILPGADDFRATAALGWNVAGLWLNAVIYDDAFIHASDRTWPDGEPADARWLDNIVVVWDNESGTSSAGSGSDRIVFVGVDGTANDWREQPLNGVTLAVQQQAQCRIVNLRLSGDYLVDSGGSSPISFQIGNRHGLTFGYNDFDPELDNPEALTRQSLVFGLPMSLSPGDYFEGDRMLPQIELVGE